MVVTTLDIPNIGAVPVAFVEIDAADRSEVIAHLAERAAQLLAEDHPHPDAAQIARRANEREEQTPSVVAGDITFPHAVIEGADPGAVVIGRSTDALHWDPAHDTVRLVVLFVGSEISHLPVMAECARMLDNPAVRREMASAEQLSGVRDSFLAARRGAGEAIVDLASAAVLEAGLHLASRLSSAKVLVTAATFERLLVPEALRNDRRVLVLGGEIADSAQEREPDAIAAHFDAIDHSSVGREVARSASHPALEGIRQAVVVWGPRDSNVLSVVQVVPLGGGGSGADAELPFPAVTTRVIDLARTIARQGREGKPIGCIFVIADPGDIAAMTHQLIVNPFLGQPLDSRNVLDPALEETLKEFAKIDGAFIIDTIGTVVSAGTYLSARTEELRHHPGEGTRHASARAISAVSEAVAVVVSESTGRVSVYRHGERL